MERLIIDGGIPLSGEINLQGSKNSALPVLAATAAVDGISVIHNCPDLSDVSAAVKILEHIGCKVKREGHTVTVDARCMTGCEIPEKQMREMRSSIVFLGALLARFGKATVTPPGGCEIGLRPIDLHLNAFRSMGVSVTGCGDILVCEAKNKIRGRHINLAFPSVGATENIILTALSAEGETVIINAAREPEITDLADFLCSCGAKITGAGQSVIRIKGKEKLNGAEHKIIPDRIVASTYMAAAAVTGGEITVSGAVREHLAPVIPVFEASGCKTVFCGNEMSVKAPKRLCRVRTIRTMPYPGFPTDSQAIVMAMLATANGTSVITEKIFENRFRHIPELIRMGADIRVEDGCIAVVDGVERLHGARVSATDLRGGCALIMAALGAEGITEIDKIYHIDRGFEAVENSLSKLGARIKREDL